MDILALISKRKALYYNVVSNLPDTNITTEVIWEKKSAVLFVIGRSKLQ
jgi:hypothetical protein